MYVEKFSESMILQFQIKRVCVNCSWWRKKYIYFHWKVTVSNHRFIRWIDTIMKVFYKKEWKKWYKFCMKVHFDN